MIGIERVKKIMKAFARQRILVIGDLMLDRYVAGSVSRISPEAPVPVVHVTGEHSLPGGSANVALNIRSLGGHAVVGGIVGQDQAGEELIELLAANKISTDGILANDKVRTTVKTRILADRQQVVRVDREDPPVRAEDIKQDFCGKVADLVNSATGVIIEDYGKGAVFQEVIDTVLSAVDASGIPVGLDPKENHDLKISGITLVTPNFREACAAAGLAVSGQGGEPESHRCLAESGDILMKKWNPDLLIITLGQNGMYVLCRSEKPRVIPTKAREVFDVSGAGDTVIAAAVLSLVSGANYYEAASFANYAAGVVVGKVGTATCTQKELLACIAPVPP